MNKEIEQAGTNYAISWHGESNQYTEPEFSYTKRDFIAGWEACQQASEQSVKPVGWISVDEKPVAYQTVLLCFEKESKGMKNIIQTGYWCGDSFITHGTPPLLTKHITHWMTLPDSPHPQEANKFEFLKAMEEYANQFKK